MPAAGLEAPFWIFVLFPELAFPIGDPSLDGKGGIAGCAETVKVVGHKEVFGDQTSGRVAPGAIEEMLGGWVGKPRDAVVSGDGQKNPSRPRRIEMNASGWILAAALAEAHG